MIIQMRYVENILCFVLTAQYVRSARPNSFIRSLASLLVMCRAHELQSP